MSILIVAILAVAGGVLLFRRKKKKKPRSRHLSYFSRKPELDSTEVRGPAGLHYMESVSSHEKTIYEVPGHEMKAVELDGNYGKMI